MTTQGGTKEPKDSLSVSVGKCASLSALANAPQPPSRSLVRDIQLALASKGYPSGAPDGVMGPSTRSAIQQFQKSLGLPATGQPSAELRMLLLGGGN